MDPFVVLGWIAVVVAGVLAAFVVVITILILTMAVRRATEKPKPTPSHHNIMGGHDG